MIEMSHAAHHTRHYAMPDTCKPSASEDEKIVPMPTPEIGLFQDLPAWIWRTFLAAWAVFFGLFIVFFTIDAEATFVVTIAALFAVMAFGLPMTMVAQSKCGIHECNGLIQTHTGPLSVGAAATQIALIPIGAVIGVIAYIMLAM